MIFLHPGYLWWATLALPLLALYLLKAKAKRYNTPALFLWQEVIDEQYNNTLFKRFQSWLSMLLLLLALLAVVIAMAGPVISTERQPLLLVIDNSASMATRHRGVSHLQQAKELAAKIIDATNGINHVTLATIANNHLTIVLYGTRNRRSLADALDEIEQTAMPLKPAALQGLYNSRQLLPNHKIILISDGGFEALSSNSTIDLVKVGRPADNIGIVAFDTVRLPGRQEATGIYFQLASTVRKRVKTALIISKQYLDNIVKVYPLDVVPGLNAPESLRVNIAANGRWFARIERRDEFASDNIALSYLPPRQTRKVAIAAADNSAFLALTIAAFRDGQPKLALNNSRAELLLASGSLPATNPAKRFIIFNPNGKSPWWNITDTKILSGLAETVMPQHPAVRFAQLDGIRFSGIKAISPPPGAVVICRTVKQIPLLYKVKRQERQGYVVNFDPAKSGFFFDINFPIMMKAMLDDLLGITATAVSGYHTGDSIPDWPVPEVQLSFSTPQQPDKKESISPVEAGAGIMSRCGFYRRQDGRQHRVYAVSLLSQADSMPAAITSSSTPQAQYSGIALRNYLLILALLLLSAESLLYHRGKTN